MQVGYRVSQEQEVHFGGGEGTLKRLRNELDSELPQIQLVGGGGSRNRMLTEQGLAHIATYAEGIGPDKQRIEQNPEVVQWAHAAGLLVHPYTFRADDALRKYGSFEKELEQFYFVYGVDGLFTDFPDKAALFLATKANR